MTWEQYRTNTGYSDAIFRKILLDFLAILLTDFLGAGTEVSMDLRSGSSAGNETATGSSARNVTVTQAASKQIPASGGKRVADQVMVQNFRAPLSTMRCLRTAILSFDCCFEL